MSHRIGLLLATTLLLTAASASAGEVSDNDRFQLWNDCKPMQLVVEGLANDATAIGLAKEAIEVAVRSRLRAARLYSEDSAEGAWSYLYVNVGVVGRAFGVYIKYRMMVRDTATELEYMTTTWNIGTTGTHGRDSSYILATVAENADKFIDEYLRVNEDACK